MTKPITILAACLALAGGTLAGCGGDDEESATTTPPAGPATTAATGASDVVTVDMKDIVYVPRDVTVEAGQTVRWTNSDPVAHTVTARRGSDLDSGTIAPGKTFEAKLEEAGKIDYFCEIHPNQTGTVTVTG